MKNPHPRLLPIGLVLILLSFFASFSTQADQILWNETFKDLKPGQALATVPYSVPCSGPQDVHTDGSNTLTGASAVGSLTSTPLLFKKGSTTTYMPSLTFKATSPITSGVITVSFDLTFDQFIPAATTPVETLMAFPFINGQGGSTYILTVACSGPSSLIIGGAGLKMTKPAPAGFKPGDVAHIKAVLDLNQHTFQAFLNDAPVTDSEKDDTKYSSFLGLTMRDGAALGGNHGETFSAGIANILITQK